MLERGLGLGPGGARQIGPGGRRGERGFGDNCLNLSRLPGKVVGFILSICEQRPDAHKQGPSHLWDSDIGMEKLFNYKEQTMITSTIISRSLGKGECYRSWRSLEAY